MRKSVSQTFEPELFYVAGWEYDTERGGWNYWLKNGDGIRYASLLKETNTKKA